MDERRAEGCLRPAAARRTDLIRISALALLPMAAAMLGAFVDERLKAGFTSWRTACRAAGFRLTSVIDFTLQLMPFAVGGLLLGGLALLMYGLARPQGARGAQCLAAHAGCALSLPVSLVLCAASIPVPLMVMLDLALAVLLANALLRMASRSAAVYP